MMSLNLYIYSMYKSDWLRILNMEIVHQLHLWFVLRSTLVKKKVESLLKSFPKVKLDFYQRFG